MGRGSALGSGVRGFLASRRGTKGDILPYYPLLDSAVPKGTRWVGVGWLGEGSAKSVLSLRDKIEWLAPRQIATAYPYGVKGAKCYLFGVDSIGAQRGVYLHQKQPKTAHFGVSHPTKLSTLQKQLHHPNRSPNRHYIHSKLKDRLKKPALNTRIS